MVRHNPKAPSKAQRITKFIGSRQFFWLTFALFLFQTSWIALFTRYPQAFDEQFHLGIITLYAQQLSPFIHVDAASTSQFGAVTADPSYLYHYLMSFPYRLISQLTDSLTTQVIALRFINIALLASSLIIYRKLFRLTEVSPAVSNFALFCFVLIPVMPLLGSQINYDNLIIPLSGLAIYMAARFSQQLRASKYWAWQRVIAIITICMLASLVKYAFLPIFLGLFVWLIIEWRWYRRQKISKPARIVLTLYQILLRIGTGVGLLLTAVVWLQRYGLNLVRYHTPLPECDQVLSITQCKSYAPWARNYSFDQFNIHLTFGQVVTYPFVWLYHIIGELIFTIASAFNTTGTINYYVGTQMILIEIIAWTVFGLGLLAVILYAKQLFQDRVLRLATMLAVFYVAVLGAQNYMEYVHLGLPVAIHGRYLLPILPIIFLLYAQAIKYALDTLRLRAIPMATRKASLALIVGAVFLLQGGGFVTYIVRSEPRWFWPQSSIAQDINRRARTILKPVVVDIK